MSMTNRSPQSAEEILKTHGLLRIADQLCRDKHLTTMEDIGRLTDAEIDALEWLKRVQRAKLKDLCEACRQGDPDLMKSISNDRFHETAQDKLFELDEAISDLRENRSRLSQFDFRDVRVEALLRRMEQLSQ